MNRTNRTAILIFLAVVWIVLACNSPSLRGPTPTPTAASKFPLRELPLSRMLVANTIVAPSALTGKKYPIAVTSMGSGSSVFSSGCPTIFHEDFDGPSIVLMQDSSPNTPNEWTVEDLSTVPKSPGLPDACSQGSLCAMTNSKSNYDDNAEALLFTPELDFTSYPKPIILTFDLAYDLEPTYDGLRIMATPDNGGKWYLVTPQGGYPPAKSSLGDVTNNVDVFDYSPGYSGDSGGWVSVLVDLGPMIAISPNWIIAFEFASDSTINKAGIAIDNIRVIPYCQSAASTSNPIAVAPMGSGNSIVSSSCPKIYDEDFEDSPVALSGESSTKNFEWEVVDLSAVSKPPGLPEACSQGSLCVITNSKSNYDDNVDTFLFTPEIDFTGYPISIILTFDLAYDLEPTFDGMRIMATPGIGSDWYLVTPQGGYPPAKSSYGDLTNNVGVFDHTPGYSGDSGGWVTVIVDLGPMLAISPHWIIAFEFASDYSINKAGIAIDNIRVIPYCQGIATPTETSTSTLTHTPTKNKFIPTTEVAPPPNASATLCSPSHPC